MNHWVFPFVFFPFFFILGVIGFLFGIIIFVFWVLMLIDAIQRKFKDPNEKIIWVLVIIFTHIIGAIIYWFLVRRHDKKKKH